MSSRSQTPNAKQKGKLDKQIMQQITISQQVKKSKTQKRVVEEARRSSTTRNKDLVKYLNVKDQQYEDIQEEICNYSPKLEIEGEKVLFTSMEIE